MASFAVDRLGAGDVRFVEVRGAMAGFGLAVAFAVAVVRYGALDFAAVGFRADEVDGALAVALDFARGAGPAESAGAAASPDARVELPMMIPPFRSPGSPRR